MAGACDVILAESCDLLVATIRDLATARDEAATYRLIAQQAIHALHDLTIERDRLRERYRRLLDESRTGRAAA